MLLLAVRSFHLHRFYGLRRAVGIHRLGATPVRVYSGQRDAPAGDSKEKANLDVEKGHDGAQHAREEERERPSPGVVYVPQQSTMRDAVLTTAMGLGLGWLSHNATRSSMEGWITSICRVRPSLVVVLSVSGTCSDELVQSLLVGSDILHGTRSEFSTRYEHPNG